jgi:hypothetical protein
MRNPGINAKPRKVGAGMQYYVAEGYTPKAKVVSNNVPGDNGSFIYVWLYADTNPVTPVAGTLSSGSTVTIQPPDRDASHFLPVVAFFLYNTGRDDLVVAESPRS